MPTTQRLRVFGGPNGSGKSTLFASIDEQFNVGYFINSDEIEKEIYSKGFINIESYGLKLTQHDLDTFKEEPNTVTLIDKAAFEGHSIDIEIRDNVLIDQSKQTHSYEASLITSFLRKHLLESKISYSFESVMSHTSKLDEIRKAKELGYKTYLYFVCLQDADMNVSRVLNRVEKGGHNVDAERVKKRYTQTLNNLLPALLLVDRAYVFDNSTTIMELIVEAKQGEIELLVSKAKVPNWFMEYVINKL